MTADGARRWRSATATWSRRSRRCAPAPPTAAAGGGARLPVGADPGGCAALAAALAAAPRADPRRDRPADPAGAGGGDRRPDADRADRARTARPATTRTASGRSARLAAALDPADPPRLRVMDLGARRRSPRCRAAPCSSTARRAGHGHARGDRRPGGARRSRARSGRGAGARRRHPGRPPLRLQRPLRRARRWRAPPNRRTAAPAAAPPARARPALARTIPTGQALRGICR